MRDPADDFTPIEAELLRQATQLEDRQRCTLDNLAAELERALARRELAEAIAQEAAAA